MGDVIHHPCQYARNELRGKLTNLYKTTANTGREHGFWVFERDGNIQTTKTQEGGINGIDVKMKSLFGMGILDTGRPIGTIHSHPKKKFNYLFSETDIKSMLNSNMEFAGIVYNKNGQGRCSIFTTSKHESYRQLEEETFQKRFGNASQIATIDMVEAMNHELKLCEFPV